MGFGFTRASRSLLLLFCLDGLPGLPHRGDVFGLPPGKDVGVAADQLATDAAADRGQIKAALLLGDLGVEHHLQQEVTEFLFQVAIVAVADGIGHFMGLFDHVGHQGGVGLLQVPGTSRLGIPQAGHHLNELAESFQVGGGSGALGTVIVGCAHGGVNQLGSPSHF